MGDRFGKTILVVALGCAFEILWMAARKRRGFLPRVSIRY
jgi:hypothetical protein